MTAAVELRSLTSPSEDMSDSEGGERSASASLRRGSTLTLAAFQGGSQQLENSSHLFDLLDDARTDKDGADLDGGSEDLGVGIGGEGGSESGGNGCLILVEEESFVEVEILGLPKVLFEKRGELAES